MHEPSVAADTHSLSFPLIAMQVIFDLCSFKETIMVCVEGPICHMRNFPSAPPNQSRPINYYKEKGKNRKRESRAQIEKKGKEETVKNRQRGQQEVEEDASIVDFLPFINKPQTVEETKKKKSSLFFFFRETRGPDSAATPVSLPCSSISGPALSFFLSCLCL